jgi:hypothetical protein
VSQSRLVGVDLGMARIGLKGTFLLLQTNYGVQVIFRITPPLGPAWDDSPLSEGG